MKLKECGTGGGASLSIPLDPPMTNSAEMAVLASKDLTTAKKNYLRLDARNYYWFKSSIPYQFSANLYNL